MFNLSFYILPLYIKVAGTLHSLSQINQIYEPSM